VAGYLAAKARRKARRNRRFSVLSHYLDIRLLGPRAESGWMLGRLIQRIHGFLAHHQYSDVAVALPEVRIKRDDNTRLNPHPGNVLRLHGEAARLDELIHAIDLDWFRQAGAINFVELKTPPATDDYICYRRARNSERGSQQQLAKRMARFTHHLQAKGIKPDPDLIHIKRKRLAAEYNIDRVFINLSSATTAQRFPFVIAFEMKSSPRLGRFSAYGLSVDGATVPYFP
jgi:CRISPR-associated endoribonuclease Cas6/Csy4 subtype I-F